MQTISKMIKKNNESIGNISSNRKTKTQLESESRLTPPPYEYIVFAINMEREKLYERINKRVDIMIDQGLIEEVEALTKNTKNFQQLCKD